MSRHAEKILGLDDATVNTLGGIIADGLHDAARVIAAPLDSGKGADITVVDALLEIAHRLEDLVRVYAEAHMVEL